MKESAFYREKYRGIDLARFSLGDLPAHEQDGVDGELRPGGDRPGDDAGGRRPVHRRPGELGPALSRADMSPATRRAARGSRS